MLGSTGVFSQHSEDKKEEANFMNIIDLGFVTDIEDKLSLTGGAITPDPKEIIKNILKERYNDRGDLLARFGLDSSITVDGSGGSQASSTPTEFVSPGFISFTSIVSTRAITPND